MDFQEKRRYVRIPVNEIGVLVHIKHSRKEIPVRICDISLDGVGLLTQDTLLPAQQFILEYTMFNRTLSFPVRVIWMTRKNDGWHAGCLKCAGAG